MNIIRVYPLYVEKGLARVWEALFEVHGISKRRLPRPPVNSSPRWESCGLFGGRTLVVVPHAHTRIEIGQLCTPTTLCVLLYKSWLDGGGDERHQNSDWPRAR